jgi:ABC-2 type transport system permease protein
MQWIQWYTLTRQTVERLMRVWIQVFAAPLVTSLLYIFIFGSIVGQRVDFGSYAYIDFVLPGIVMMMVINAAFMHGSNEIYFKRFIKTIEEVLTAPIPNWMYILSVLASGVVRALLMSAGIFGIAVFFGAANLQNIVLFLGYVSGVAAIFTLLGIVVGLWAKGFEQLNVLSIFVVTPLSYLGGVFYSITMLPSWFVSVVLVNPMFYFIDGIRYAMIGVHESNLYIGAAVIGILTVSLYWLVMHLFTIGYGIRA